MPLITEQRIRQLGKIELAQKGFFTKKSEILSEQAKFNMFDIFLSHAYMDRELILGLRTFFISLGYKVYIDWIDDEELDRSDVTKETANKLKGRMGQSKCLLYAITENYVNSKWMPWELGYFDGREGKVAVLPLVKSGTEYEYKGTEYVGLYPYVKDIGSTSASLYVYDDKGNYVSLHSWMDGATLG
ncbi:toll/interleukin-1 receptor domain-containing protein [Priestia abyssalis]|uniref:toll/interleukin-1 receptor domain-containing protein n=1 Tax=Priestia abyssalis TaxID=1221450 RepID=UPI0011170AB7|nr:toll/interleukin-1 receptor domain-containing protein [Priestia abyssalis]